MARWRKGSQRPRHSLSLGKVSIVEYWWIVVEEISLPLTSINASELTGSKQSETYAMVTVGTAVRATEIMPYPMKRLGQCSILSTPYPKRMHPAPVTNTGGVHRYSRLSGSNTPLLRLVFQSQNTSTNKPPAQLPTTFPMKPGMLIRPLIIGDQLYGGAWRTKGLRMLTDTVKTSDTAYPRNE